MQKPMVKLTEQNNIGRLVRPTVGRVNDVMLVYPALGGAARAIDDKPTLAFVTHIDLMPLLGG
jgi:hypothetical protein